jgi:spectinomycin phosphotransferase
MLEPPDIQDQLIITRVQDAYGLQITRVDFLPLGADVDTASYRATAEGGTAYFLKLRKGSFNEITVTLPQLLKARGVCSVLAPLATRDRRGWASLGEYRLILYPYIEGKNGYEAGLSDRLWLDFGATLAGVHAVQATSPIARSIPRETYSSCWRDMVEDFQARIEETVFADPVAAKLAAFLRARKDMVNRLVAQAEDLAHRLRERSLEPVLCHADIHPGNLLIGTQDTGADDGDAHGRLYIVDWDSPIFAPKEKDLALVGGCPTWNDPRCEALFYQGYGRKDVDPMALAYYRSERAIQDIAAFCQQLLLSSEGGEDREQSYQYLTGSFMPGHEIDLALHRESL